MKLGKHVKIYPWVKVVYPENISIGDETIIDDFVFLYGAGKGIEIGRFSHIVMHCSIAAGGLVKIGDFVGVAHGCIILGASDDYEGNGLIGHPALSGYRKPYLADVVLGNHAHIGAGSIVLPGVTIGEGCSVGAGSVVTKSLPEWTICYGNPCKVRKDKPREKQLEMERMFLEERDREAK